MMRSRVTFARIDAAAIDGLFASPPMTASDLMSKPRFTDPSTRTRSGVAPIAAIARRIASRDATAECAGAHGVIIPKRRAAGLTFSVGKASAGAYEYMPVARVTNIPATIDELKEKGLWIYGADMDGETYCTSDLKGACALVIGSEGKGLQRLVKEKCDVILSLPMLGKINSLNASVAAGVLMYEFTRQRLEIKAK